LKPEHILILSLVGIVLNSLFIMYHAWFLVNSDLSLDEQASRTLSLVAASLGLGISLQGLVHAVYQKELEVLRLIIYGALRSRDDDVDDVDDDDW